MSGMSSGIRVVLATNDCVCLINSPISFVNSNFLSKRCFSFILDSLTPSFSINSIPAFQISVKLSTAQPTIHLRVLLLLQLLLIVPIPIHAPIRHTFLRLTSSPLLHRSPRIDGVLTNYVIARPSVSPHSFTQSSATVEYCLLMSRVVANLM